jgi:hypothetical protein
LGFAAGLQPGLQVGTTTVSQEMRAERKTTMGR